MGRPLKKSFFGNPAQSDKRVALTSAWLPGEVGPAAGFYIVRQVGTGRFQVTNGTVTGVVRLVDGEPLAAGKACLAVQPYGDDLPVEYARVLYNRSVKTHDGNSYKWNAGGAKTVGEADIFGVEDAPVVAPSVAPAEPAEPAPTTQRRASKPAPVEPEPTPAEPDAPAEPDTSK